MRGIKSFEAIFTLLVVVSFSLLILNQPLPGINDSLYRLQLAHDVWRVWQLRGDLDGFDKNAMNRDADAMTALTGTCIYLEEEDVASCLGGERIIALPQKAWVNGEVKNLTVVLAKQ
ncbi:MAG TPA: hypothetical protein VJH24_01315 [Candidatus Bilamarchaeaceae archaeon]|nr:hypothetical protein [Candidatus Bilamarchaeaceae archaeon]